VGGRLMPTTNASGMLPSGWFNMEHVRQGVYGQIKAAYDDGESDSQIARRVGVSSRTVARWREGRGLEPNPWNRVSRK
jgi:AraC-like DNA-binding protein